MAKIDITDDEKTTIHDALEAAVSSAQRQRNMKGRTMQMNEVWKQHEQTLRAVQSKIATAK